MMEEGWPTRDLGLDGFSLDPGVGDEDSHDEDVDGGGSAAKQ
jgi:hypothetical protein